ncbi:hypothetical protein KDH_16010 [Dictyobacter sp. S3.2.2.5]|uniref:Uncharacterized protein n=1 Tax=Dictyobacter halimunensis TaxID=3026934 RepID=A0ABQ6FQR8_9CHLR|nr:hypothetical protein KDH_16010 [Dictyobacter sp. S3.2.2.5]
MVSPRVLTGTYLSKLFAVKSTVATLLMAPKLLWALPATSPTAGMSRFSKAFTTRITMLTRHMHGS